MGILETKTAEKISMFVPESIKESRFDKEVAEATKIYNKLEEIYKNNPKILNNIKKEYKEVLDARNKAKSKEGIMGDTLIAEEYSLLRDEVNDLKRTLKVIEKYKYEADKIISNLEEKYSKNSDEYKNALIEYSHINSKIEKYIKDGKIDSYEFNEIKIEHSDIKKIEYQSKSFYEKSLGAIYNIYNETLLSYSINENEEIIGYKNGEHYTIKIANFEKKIKDKSIPISELNSKGLASYLEYINNKGELNIESLRKNFGENKIEQLGQIWKYRKGDTITQKLLNEAGISEIINQVISFSDIISNPIDSINALKIEELPKKDDVLKLPIEEIYKFNQQYNGACPTFRENQEENIKKLDIILALSKSVEIEKKGNFEFNKQFAFLVEKRLQDKGLSEDQIKKIKEKGEKLSNDIFEKGLDILELPEKSCGFNLAIFIKDEINIFFEKNNLDILTENERIDLGETIAKTNILKVEDEEENITNRINILTSLENRTDYEEEELTELNIHAIKVRKKVQKAYQVYETVQASDFEIESYKNIIENGGTREDAFNEFKNNRTVENSIDYEKGLYETKIIEYENGEELTYHKTNQGYNIYNGSDNGLDITEKEFDEIKSSPIAKENLLNFYDFFVDEVNIPVVWERRDEILKAIGSNDIKNDKDSIKKGELELISNQILELIYGEKFNLKLASAKLKLNEFSEHSSMLSDNKTYGFKGTGKLENLMINNGILVNGKFNIQRFRDMKKIGLVNQEKDS